ncbi:TnsA endonuclease N-terminal domain-containing protein [Bacillus luteolus]|uniref:TnsA endonuclease N-terminal domain-containing protein n=1 Tax=Litchfieldia luteola TaxID=682179 RepID=A0ABR9QFB7_9BACI|nr:TnsA endonuclease N-terminal domain-containing protein [Cytobacillus luteolus]MBE4906944.1 TnsA endonuclease N-terminal domain-containing protein [Cytobacillus luteolus]MBP1943591.1 putative transposase [Cytobacillus luteolus]
MNNIKLEKWLQDKGIPNDGMKQIQNVRRSEPSRKVKSNGKNVPGFYPSKKMGLTIQFESHKLELAGIYEKEHDPNVIEYYDQPPSFTIRYQDKEGKNRGHRYTPDFFVIEEDWIGWEEWKTEQELIVLSQKNPNRYSIDESGNWRCPPAEKHANECGLSFRIRSSKDIDWTYQRNIRFLEDYLLEQTPNICDETSSIIKKIIGDKPSISLDELLSNQSTFDADDIYTMMVLDEIYADITRYLIIDFDKFPLFLNKEAFIAYQNMKSASNTLPFKPITLDISVGNKIQWDSKIWRIINIGESVITLLSQFDEPSEIPMVVFEDLIIKGSISEIQFNNELETEEEITVLNMIRQAGEKDLEDANKKYFIVKGLLEGRSLSEYDIPDRTLRDWMKKYKDAEKVYGNGYVGLLPLRHRQGNRTRRLPLDVLELMDEYIENDFETIIQKNSQTVFNAFREKCIAKGYSPPSFKTFCRRIKDRPINLQIKKRKGTKAAYNTEQVYYELSLTTPRHGDRPFEICHIDHTELDIELICSETGGSLGRPWITFLVDAFSRRILAFYLTFDEPSYRSCMMVLRECVRRYSRMPSMIVVDGGKEFHSVYFDTLIARYKGKKIVRPGAKPKFGSVCERLFGTTNEMLIHNLMGNTQIMKNVRQITKEVNPKKHSVWNLEELYLIFIKWCYEVYDTTPHSSLGESPRELYVRRIAKTGSRKNTYIKYDETFKMLTLPTTKKGTAKVVVGQGVKINYFYYWAEVFLHPDVEGENIPIRYDPYNIGIAYAYVNNYWVMLNSENFSTLANRTEKELKIATAELRKRKRQFGQKKQISSSQIVKFLQSAEEFEQMQLQKLKDKAVQRTFRVIEGGNQKQDDIVMKKNNTKEEKQETASSNRGKNEVITQLSDVVKLMKEQNSFQIYKEL